ncbi:MAG: heparan-alpha-glucosaminide N-acetyltransferase [Candidatus Fimousia sp.]
MKKQTKRYLLIDGFRGVAIISMIIFHFLYDVNEVFGVNTGWYENTNIHIWQQSICWSFIIISGFVWQLGIKSNIKRGVILNICGIVITLVTTVFTPSQIVWFGILNFMGCASLIMIPLNRIAGKISSLLGMILSMSIFVICRNITEGIIGIKNIFVIELPDWLYESKILTPLGFPFRGFTSSDYFPVLPWLALFLFGYYLYSYANRTGKLGEYAYRNIPVLTQIGQKSIWIYLLHQPICMAVCEIILL